MTIIDGTYTLFVDRHSTLRVQMLGAPHSVYVGGAINTEPSGTLLVVSAPTRQPDPDGSLSGTDTHRA